MWFTSYLRFFGFTKLERFKLPVRYGVQVTAIDQESGSQDYTITTSKGEFQSASVVIATGLFQKPKIPTFSTEFPAEITQLDTQCEVRLALRSWGGCGIDRSKH